MRRAAVEEALRDFGGTVIRSEWLQGWANVVGSGIPPSEVVVFAVGNRDGSQAERRVGAALGARVIV
jgi:hypothetical protein